MSASARKRTFWGRRFGPRLCEKSKTLDRDRTSYSFKALSTPTPQAHSILKSNPRISFSSRFDFLSFHTAWARCRPQHCFQKHVTLASRPDHCDAPRGKQPVRATLKVALRSIFD